MIRASLSASLSASLLVAVLTCVACGSSPTSNDGGGGDAGGGAGGGSAGGSGPTITSTSPQEAATGVALTTPIVVQFSKPLNPTSVSLTLAPTTNLSALIFDANNSIVTVQPTPRLLANTPYTVTVAAKDMAGRSLSGPSTFHFRTAAVVDTTPPTVLSTTPADAATNVSAGTSLSVTFSEPMDTAATSVVLSPGVALGPPTFTLSDTLLQYVAIPLSLPDGITYTATISGRDVAGNALAGATTFRFTVSSSADTTPPTVVSTVPISGAVNVPVSTSLSITFSEPMNQAATIGSIALNQNGPLSTCAGRWTFNVAGTGVSCTPVPPFQSGVAVNLTIGTQAKDLAGNALASPRTVTFTPTNADLTPPTVLSTSPADMTRGVVRLPSIQVDFSEAMDPLTTTALSCLTLTMSVNGTMMLSNGNQRLTLTPSAALASGDRVTCNVRSTAAKDAAGNAMVSDYNFGFVIATQGSQVLGGEAVLDGSITNTTPTYSVSFAGVTASAGDTAGNLISRTFLSFDLSTLPGTTVRITQATLTVYQVSVNGSPFLELGNVISEHVSYDAVALANPAMLYGQLPLQAGIVTLSSVGGTGARTVDVTAFVEDDRAHRSKSQFRLRFDPLELSNDNNADSVSFGMTEEPTSTLRPTLSLTYDLP